MVPVVTSEHRHERGAPPEAQHASVVRLLAEVEALPADATGALTFGVGERMAGAVLVERGRVCWAGASGLQRRLTDLLVQKSEPPLDHRVIRTLYAQCRRDGRPLGERLVEEGVVTAEGLRAALLEHSVEAMLALCRLDDARRLWAPHKERRYDAAFTFAPVELLRASSSALLAECLEAADAELVRVVDGEAIGVALWRGGGVAAPVPVAHVAPTEVSVRDLRVLARWAVGVLDMGVAIDGGTHLMLASRDDGATFVTWRRRGLIYAAVCEEPTVGACVVARLTRRAAG